MENWSQYRILVVDDLKIKHLIISRLLESTRVQITSAINGKEAVEYSSKEHFDIILMNILMPLMDGFDATKEIRKFNNDVVIIAQTNYGDIREKCLREGFNDYIRYPFGKEDLIQVIKKYIKV